MTNCSYLQITLFTYTWICIEKMLVRKIPQKGRNVDHLLFLEEDLELEVFSAPVSHNSVLLFSFSVAKVGDELIPPYSQEPPAERTGR
jgi:hypothetical protein